MFTNTVSTGPYRGAGRPESVLNIERLIDKAAKDLGIDRVEIRRKNFIRPEDMPYDFGLMFQDGRPLIYDTGDYQAGIDKLKKLIDWDGFPEYQRKARAEGRSVGIGIGAYVEGRPMPRSSSALTSDASVKRAGGFVKC